MHQIGDNYTGYTRDRRKYTRTPAFCPAGQSTQMIVGASKESDLQILHLSQSLYSTMHLKRVYFSAYVGVNEEPDLLPAVSTAPPLLREHRLYQADWLMRYYHFQAEEIVPPEQPNLDVRIDPKAAWALRNFDLFPLDIATAGYEELLRVPGIGVLSARRIMQTRRATVLRPEDLKKIGCVMKRARFFTTLGGRMLTEKACSQRDVARELRRAEPLTTNRLAAAGRQLRLF